MMTVSEFESTLSQSEPSQSLTPALAGLWRAAKDDWDTAHHVVMDEGGKDCAWVYAYLHRVEGDMGNADYWYRKAAKKAANGALQAEWAAIAAALLAK
jgi:hypothetical protein